MDELALVQEEEDLKEQIRKYHAFQRTVRTEETSQGPLTFTIREKRIAFYTTKEAAELFGDVTPTTVLNWIKKGMLHALNDGPRTWNYIPDYEIERIRKKMQEIATKNEVMRVAARLVWQYENKMKLR